MTFQGGDFGEGARHEANQPPPTPQARPWEEFAPPAYAQPDPSASHNPPPPAPPVPPWNPPGPNYPPPGYPPQVGPPQAGYGPPGHHDGPGFGGPLYPPPPPQFDQSYPPPPSYAGGYGAPPGYPGPYDFHQPYRDRSHETNGLAIASLITSVVGGLLGIPLSFVCFVGILIPVVGAVLGGAALSQIKRTNQKGRGLAIAGIAVGATAAVLLVLLVVVVMAAMRSSPSLT